MKKIIPVIILLVFLFGTYFFLSGLIIKDSNLADCSRTNGFVVGIANGKACYNVIIDYSN